MRNWQAAALAWVVAVIIAIGGYVVWQTVAGRSPKPRLIVEILLLALLYAVWLGWRFRERR